MRGFAGTLGIKPLTMQNRNQEESKFIPGGVEAFSKLVDDYQHRVHGFVRRMVPSSEDAEDITQEVFIRAFQNYERFDARASVRTWLFRIAYNLCVDRSRKAGRTVQQVSMNMSPEIADEYEVADTRWQPDTILEDTEMYSRVEQAIGRMSEKLRSVLILHDKEDLSYEEISESLGIPIGTVKSRLFLARNQLQQAVRDLVEESR
jgi:RNA polymerase sigma-70 factor (ECF subfamily)